MSGYPKGQCGKTFIAPEQKTVSHAITPPQEDASNMTSNYEVRPFLGKSQPVILGGLFDARSETMSPRSILKCTNIPQEAIARIDEQGLSYTYTTTDSLKEKMTSLGVTAELGISALCGRLGGSLCGDYLSDSHSSSQARQASTVLKFTRATETLRLDSDCLKDLLTLDALHDTGATHVVCGIEWGARTVFTAKERTDNTMAGRFITGGITKEPPGGRESSSVSPSKFVKLIGSMHASGRGGSESNLASFESDLSLEVKADVVDVNNWDVPTTFDGMRSFLQNIPSVVDSLNGGKGVPVAFHIVPTTCVATMFKVDIQRTSFLDQLKQDDFDKCVDTLVKLQEQTHRARRYALSVEQHDFCVPQDHIEKAGEELRKAERCENRFRLEFEAAVRGIRFQSPDLAPQQHLCQIPQLIKQTEADLLDNSVFGAYNETMNFADHVKSLGGEYVPHSQLGNIVIQDLDVDLYLLHFSSEAQREVEWDEEMQTVLGLLKALDDTYRVYVVDYDVPQPGTLASVHVEHRRGGKTIVHDVTQHHKDISKLCLIKCNAHEADRSRSFTPPSGRRVVRISCPGNNCFNSGRVKWICPVCLDHVCYGFTDEYLYCLCSRYHFTAAMFRCNSAVHGPKFDKYEQDALHQRLKALDITEEYTILIVGKTGVGKSMFINFLANYLEFKTLEAAMKDKKKSVRYQIPCSFVWKSRDKKEVKVQVGAPSIWERVSTKGQSSTRRTLTHCFDIGGKTFRFIDTPGIMDTGGAKQDVDNLKDILKMLEATRKLNAILFMISPNEARLDDHFQAYVSELLFRLHKDTANNIMFGFANASASNFSIGASQGPLDGVLDRLQTGLKRGEGNQFFFESSPFMFLAAYKQNLATTGQRQHYARLWKQSGEQMQRFFRTVMDLPSHDMEKTLKLHRTASILDGMAKPLAVFATSSKVSQAQLLKAEGELEETIAQGGYLAEEALAKVTIETRVRYNLATRRTVCTHESCVTQVQDENGDTRTDYSQICHDKCDLTEAAEEIPGDEHLSWCRPFRRWLFSYGHECDQCGHGLQDHMHVSYELRKTKRRVTDSKVLDKIKSNEEKQAVLEGELQAARNYQKLLLAERSQIQAVRALVSVHLAHSTVGLRPMERDATMRYLNFQINTARKDHRHDEASELETQRKEHMAEVETLESNIRSKGCAVPSDRAVDEAIEGLGQMQVLGKDLRASLEPEKIELDVPRFVFAPFKSWCKFPGWTTENGSGVWFD